MLLQVPDVLNAEQVAWCQQQMATAQWVDGRVTAGHQSARAKHNEQLPENSPQAHAMGDLILMELERNALFLSAAVPQRIFPPLFNRYSGGQSFGTHVDNAVRPITGTAQRIRTDLSCTLFLADPTSYDGGELVVEDTYGVQRIKLNAGSMVLYPSTSLHHVAPVTRGTRLASFFWLQSLVRLDAHRSILFDLDLAIQQLKQRPGNEAQEVALTGVYHNLLRLWIEP